MAMDGAVQAKPATPMTEAMNHQEGVISDLERDLNELDRRTGDIRLQRGPSSASDGEKLGAESPLVLQIRCNTGRLETIGQGLVRILEELQI